MSEAAIPSTAPFVPQSTPNIDRANRLIALRQHPGFLDLLRLSQDLVQSAADQCADFAGWDTMQIVVLKVRMQAAKEHHQLLLARISEVINLGIDEAKTAADSLPEKSVADMVDQGDYVRQKVLEQFAENDTRPSGSY